MFCAHGVSHFYDYLYVNAGPKDRGCTVCEAPSGKFVIYDIWIGAHMLFAAFSIPESMAGQSVV